MPPTTWTGQMMMTTDPCRCLRQPVRASVARMDPLVAAAFHNLSCSPLCRLPEELLIDIMKRLDILTIQCLRRVCRIFLRLYCSQEFSHLYVTIRPRDSYSHWYGTRPQAWFPRQISPLLDKDIGGYCGECRAKRMDKNWKKNLAALATKYLHCSGCRAHHPAGLFSSAQRSAPSTSRICIGREGYFRVCDHLVVKWADFASAAWALSELNTQQAVIVVATCHNNSHEPRHHMNDPALTARQKIRPIITIRGCSKTLVCLHIQWLGHRSLPHADFDKQGYSELATPTRLRRQLERFRQGTGEYIAPEFPAGPLTEMNCFDPNRCLCLRYAGREHVPGGWDLTQRPADFLACRERPDCGLKALRAFRDKEDRSLERSRRTESHHVVVHTVERTHLGQSMVGIDIEPCPAQPQCLQISYGRCIGIRPEWYGSWQGEIRVTWAWCQALDPASYNLTDDTASFGILWCGQKGCRNYYRYLRPAFFPVAETHRECRWPCSG